MEIPHIPRWISNIEVPIGVSDSPNSDQPAFPDLVNRNPAGWFSINNLGYQQSIDEIFKAIHPKREPIYASVASSRTAAATKCSGTPNYRIVDACLEASAMKLLTEEPALLPTISKLLPADIMRMCDFSADQKGYTDYHAWVGKKHAPSLKIFKGMVDNYGTWLIIKRCVPASNEGDTEEKPPTLGCLYCCHNFRRKTR